jgi:hypothetical protein
MSEQSSQPKPNKKTGRFTAPIVVGSLVYNLPFLD